MTRSIERDVDIANQRVAAPPIAGWVCRIAMIRVVLHAPVGR